MEIFPFLSFPSVVTDGILRKLTPYELFAFSLHSEEARNILKRFSSSHKFHMEIDLSLDRLTFNYENEEKNSLILESYPQDEPKGHILKFDELDENVFADIETDEDVTIVEVYFEKKERAERLQFLIEYMAKVFKNISISIYVGCMSLLRDYEKMKKDQSAVVRIIKATIKKCNFNIRSYWDKTYIHTFKELEPLITCGRLEVLKCQLTNVELKKLFDKWMEMQNPGEITFGKFNDNFKLEELSTGNVIKSRGNTSLRKTQFFDVTHANGNKVRIEFWNGTLYFKVNY